MKVEVKVIELSHDDIVTIISGADGTIGCWCQSMGLGKELYSKYRRDDDCIEDVQARALLDGQQMVFVDAEEDDKYYLTYNNLCTGVEKWLSSGYGSSKEFSNEFDGCQDGYDYDMIIQFALFDDVIYG